MTSTFYEFAAKKKCNPDIITMDQCVDTCLDAMEVGELDVCLQFDDFYLWEWYRIWPHQWSRICTILQRQGIPSSIVWDKHCHPNNFSGEFSLTGIKYMWEDLAAIQGALARWKEKFHISVFWLEWQVEHRLWATGLRRAWLVAITTAS